MDAIGVLLGVNMNPQVSPDGQIHNTNDLSGIIGEPKKATITELPPDPVPPKEKKIESQAKKEKIVESLNLTDSEKKVVRRHF